jgi:hypothetical protein
VGPEGSAAELARFVAEDWVAAEAAAELANSYGRSLIACPFLRLVLFGQIPYELVQTPFGWVIIANGASFGYCISKG